MKNIYIALPEGYVRKTFFTPMVLEQMEAMDGMNFTFNDTGDFIKEKDLKEVLKCQDGCILGWGCSYMSADLFNDLPRLRVLGVLGGSVQPYIDEDFFNSPDRIIINSANIMAKSVAEATLAYMMCGLRDLSLYDKKMKEGMLWKQTEYYNEGLFHKTIGLVGLGQVGRYLVEFLKPFDVEILLYDPYISDEDNIFLHKNVKRRDLNTTLSQANIVSVHAAYTDETRYMLNRDKLSLLKPGTLLVNTARGGIIDEEALIEVLNQGHIKAVLDVYEKEPLPLESKLRQLDNVVLIPHMAGPTIDMRQYMTLSIIEDMKEIFEGREVTNQITLEQYRIMT